MAWPLASGLRPATPLRQAASRVLQALAVHPRGAAWPRRAAVGGRLARLPSCVQHGAIRECSWNACGSTGRGSSPSTRPHPVVTCSVVACWLQHVILMPALVRSHVPQACGPGVTTEDVSVGLTHARWLKAARRPLSGSPERLALVWPALLSRLLSSPMFPSCPGLRLPCPVSPPSAFSSSRPQLFALSPGTSGQSA